MRTFRHNQRQAAAVEPERCELCHQLAVEQLVHVYPNWLEDLVQRVCGDCLVSLVALLQRRGLEYRVGAASATFNNVATNGRSSTYE